MGKLYEAYVHSFILDKDKDRDFFSHILDLYETEEFQSMGIYPQHGNINRIQHILSVTYVAYTIAQRRKKADVHQTLRGSILHDLFYYDWHVPGDGSHRLHGYRHPGFALKNAIALYPAITEIEKNIIKRHMWPLTPTPPKYLEGFIVSMSDKYCATQEVLLSRIEQYNKKFQRDVALAAEEQRHA
ncbi:MAG: hypothetical protein IJ766_10470 [Clostridia bacterium]|nr:hypothetical protein [Clostridia bacterium]